MANNRIYYPIQQVVFRKPGTTVFREAHGVQSVATTTTFNLEQAFELGQLAIYENIEGIPDVEVTMSKVLDGYPLLYLLAAASDADGANLAGPTLAQRAPAETMVQLGIWNETEEAVNGSPVTYVEMSGLTVSSVSYNFPLEDNFSEDVTLAGNTKVWNTYNPATCAVPWTVAEATGSPNFADNSDAPIGSGGVNRRENMIFATDASEADDADYTRLPSDIFGVKSDGSKSGIVHVSSITVSTDLAREDLFELGARSPYAKTVTFPVEVTCDFEVTSISGDQVNAIDDCGGAAAICTNAQNLTDQTIRIATCEGTRIYLGTKNKLSSVSYGGGDAGGGNVSVTYSYQTFNDFTVLHSGDDFNALGQTWWGARSGYLGASTQGT
ncbi:MAG: hypothetical protein ACXABD_04740 [Candidatus Thorarchaeota archaeon]|jgi:hypothetical protein